MVAFDRPTLGSRLPDPLPTSVSLEWDGTAVRVRGPLGLEVARYEPEELDLSADAVEGLLGDAPSRGATLVAGDGRRGTTSHPATSSST